MFPVHIFLHFLYANVWLHVVHYTFFSLRTPASFVLLFGCDVEMRRTNGVSKCLSRAVITVSMCLSVAVVAEHSYCSDMM